MSCNFRSSHQRCSVKKGFLKDFRKFTGKHLRIFQNFTRTPFWKNISGWLLKTRLWQRCFLVNTLFLENPRWLLLFWVSSLPTLQLSHFENQNILAVKNYWQVKKAKETECYAETIVKCYFCCMVLVFAL